MGYLDGSDSFTSVRNDQYLSSFTTTTIRKNYCRNKCKWRSANYVCFANVDGYQRIGSYVGTGNGPICLYRI